MPKCDACSEDWDAVSQWEHEKPTNDTPLNRKVIKGDGRSMQRWCNAQTHAMAQDIGRDECTHADRDCDDLTNTPDHIHVDLIEL